MKAGPVARRVADQKVAVSFPHPANVSAGFTISMLRLFQYDAMHNQRIVNGGALIANATGAVIARGRNQIVSRYLTQLDAGVEWLWMVDTDMTFPPDIVDRLVQAAHPKLRPVVGGLCFAYMADMERRLWPTLYAWVEGTQRLRRLVTYPADQMIQVAGTGAACLLVHRTVLEAMAGKYPPPRPWFDETKFYQQDVDGNPIMETGDEYSEDLTFCLRAQAVGAPVYVHTGIKLGHIKSFEADESGFLAESAQLAQARRPTLPTYAVIASKSRREMLGRLLEQLAGQVDEVFVYDNGYQPPLEGATRAEGWPLHRMWNHGLGQAQRAAQGPHNVMVLNDDLEVPNELAVMLEGGLRAEDDIHIAYPDVRGVLKRGEIAQIDNPGLAGQTMTGYAFMLRGEADWRIDEAYGWWYGDSDLERRVREAGKRVVSVGGITVRHLDPMGSTLGDAERLAQAEADEALFAEVWKIDPSTLWLAQRKVPA